MRISLTIVLRSRSTEHSIYQQLKIQFIKTDIKDCSAHFLPRRTQSVSRLTFIISVSYVRHNKRGSHILSCLIIFYNIFLRFIH